ncbi:MAG TPA: hypothetical protein PKH77_22005 [Anaerolineae bacterium]|nr:hypothetical protein [Anaerolineae bacterium]
MKNKQRTRHDAQFMLRIETHVCIEKIRDGTGYTISQLIVIAVEMYGIGEIAPRARKKKAERVAARIVLPVRTDRLLRQLQACYAREGVSASRQDILDDAIFYYSQKYS